MHLSPLRRESARGILWRFQYQIPQEDTPMCGIVGFIGREEAAPILLAGLARLEDRG